MSHLKKVNSQTRRLKHQPVQIRISKKEKHWEKLKSLKLDLVLKKESKCRNKKIK